MRLGLASNISLSPVHMHKHLGVIFSNDCKWTKHIDVLIERTSKQLNILRKLKYRLTFAATKGGTNSYK
jgi:hypothetical protein